MTESAFCLKNDFDAAIILVPKVSVEPSLKLSTRIEGRHLLKTTIETSEMRKIGYLPDTPALSSLVWRKESKTLYFIGFRDRNVSQPKGPMVDIVELNTNPK